MKKLLKLIPFFVIAAILVCLLFFPETRSEAAEKRIVEVWNVDTFEGGKGSRTSFLAKAARRIEGEGVYYYVLSYTAEGARAALSEGKKPDMLSFGVGLWEFAEECKPLPYSFSGGSIGGHCLAVPWCAGKYVLFSLGEEFGEEGEVAVSCGGSNLSVLSAAFGGVKGKELPSDAAYIGFLNGDYRYLLGTQRDICRFQSRGVTVYTRDLDEYNDLFQYIAILSEEKREDCMRLVEELLSGRTQELLSGIGMETPKEPVRTVSVFASSAALSEVSDLARAGEDLKKIEKYLKFH